MNRLLLGVRQRKVLKVMRSIVMPMVKSLQKPGHSIPLDVLLDPFVLGYIRTYSQIAIHQVIDEGTERERQVFATTLEPFFVEVAGSKAGGKEMVRALVKYSDSRNDDLERGGNLAARIWAVSTAAKYLRMIRMLFEHSSSELPCMRLPHMFWSQRRPAAPCGRPISSRATSTLCF